MMYGREKSDSVVVAGKSPNKTGQPAACWGVRLSFESHKIAEAKAVIKCRRQYVRHR